MTSGNSYYLKSFIDLVNTACNENVFVKKADLSKKTKRNIGNALIATGIATPVFFATRGKFKLDKFNKLMRAGAVKNISELDKAVASHIRKTNAKLPKYKWEDFTNSIFQRGKRVHSKNLPVAVLRNGGMNSGPGYIPAHDIITLGRENVLNPKTLMHELGHAADNNLGEYMSRPGLTFGELFKGLINPEKTRMLKAELRAWDNAKILKGDALREAALDTYRNGVRGQSATAIVTPATVVGGAVLRSKNKEEKGWPKAAQARLKPISYFDEYKNGDPELDSIFAERRRARELEQQKRDQQQARFRRNRMYQQQVRDRQSITAPIKQRGGWTGFEVRHGDGVSTSRYHGPINSYRNPNIAAPGATPRDNQVAWEDLPSTRMMQIANGERRTRDAFSNLSQTVRDIRKPQVWDYSSVKAVDRLSDRVFSRQLAEKRRLNGQNRNVATATGQQPQAPQAPQAPQPPAPPSPPTSPTTPAQAAQAPATVAQAPQAPAPSNQQNPTNQAAYTSIFNSFKNRGFGEEEAKRRAGLLSSEFAKNFTQGQDGKWKANSDEARKSFQDFYKNQNFAPSASAPKPQVAKADPSLDPQPAPPAPPAPPSA